MKGKEKTDVKKKLGGEKKKKMKTRHIASIVIVAIVALAAFSIIPVSAQGDPGAGCTAETEFHDTIHGGVYFEQQGYAQYNSMTKTFTDVPDGIKAARIYTGFWQGSPSKGGNFNITIANATGSYTTLTYQACDPCPGAPCAATQSLRCDALNWTGNVPPNVPSGDIHDYIVGCGVQFVSSDATPYITPGSNTITVRTSCGANCTCWDGRIYVIALLVVYENSSMPEITYWINEGAPYLEKGSDCDGSADHLYASKYFNGTHVSDPIGVRLWSLGWPHVINAETKLNGNNIGGPDIIEKYGSSEVLLRWNNISTGYLGTTSNFLKYYDLNPVYERAFAEVLIVQAEDEKPDLIVTDINSYHNHTGCPAWFNLLNEMDVTVKNNGSAAAGASSVSLYIEGDYADTAMYYFGKLPVPPLGAGASHTVTFIDWVPIGDDCQQPPCEYSDSYKDYNFTAVADCDGVVIEGNETNNATTMQDRTCYNGYMADEPLENVAHGVLQGGVLFTTGDGSYGGLYSVGDSRSTNYNITLSPGATVEFAHLKVFYTWHYEKTSCPQMVVSITNATGTYVLPLEKAYNDLKCACPGASWVFPWGNYVYDLTDYIPNGGEFTVTVKRTGGPSFCIAAPGVDLVYKDEDAPLIEYWINEGADILMGGRRYLTSSNLAWWECINNATFPASTQTEEVVNATLGVVAPWGDSIKDDILFFNDVELGRGVYNGYSSLYSKAIGGLSMYVGASGRAQVGANVTSVTTQYLQSSANVVGQADDGDNIMACNAFLVVEYCKMPDLVVEKNVTFDDGNFTVSYTVKNVGCGTAGESHVCKYLNGTLAEKKAVPALGSGESNSSSFDPEPCPCGATLNVTVCADCDDEVTESDETNNCEVNIVPCPGEPDLVVVVEKSVTFDDGNFTVSYTVKNVGCGTAGESHVCKYLNGTLAEKKAVPALGSGESNSSSFDPEPCPCGATLNVTVCADCDDEVTESDETNNCEVNIVRCPVVEKPDLNVTEITVNYDASSLGGRAIGPEPGPDVHTECNNLSAVIEEDNGVNVVSPFDVTFKVDGTTLCTVRVPGLNGGTTKTVYCNCSWYPYAGDAFAINVTADSNHEIAESDETNNTMWNTGTVVSNGYKGDGWQGPGKNLTNVQCHPQDTINLIYSVGDSYYLSGATLWTEYTANWTTSDLPVPEDADIEKAMLYVYYTWDKDDVMPGNVNLKFNDNDIPLARHYSDSKGFGGYDYPSGMLVYNVLNNFAATGTNNAILTKAVAADVVSMRGMLLMVVYNHSDEPERMICIDEGYDMLYAKDSYAVSSEEATTYAPFECCEPVPVGELGKATLIAVAPSASDGDDMNRLSFNDGLWNGIWDHYEANTQLGIAEANVLAYIEQTENRANFQSHIPAGGDKGDFMDASNAFLVVQYEEEVQHPLWKEINAELDKLKGNVSAATMPSIIQRRLVDKLEYAKALKENAKEECEAGNFDGATKKLGVAKSQVDSFASMVKITRRISSADKASFLADSTVIIAKIDELIEYIETEHKC